MTAAEIKKDTSQHMVQGFIVFALVYLVTYGVMVITHRSSSATLLPLAVAAVFAIAETMVLLPLWCNIATRHIDRLPVFYNASAGLRFVAVLLILFVAYLVVGRGNMLPYVLSLLLYYVVLLVLHSVFFARENSRLFNTH